MTTKAVRLLDPSTGLMECKVCGARHYANIRPQSVGRYYPASWQCQNGCRTEESAAEIKTDDDLRTTALHEAGHAVAFYRLFGDSGRYGGLLSIVHADGNLGRHAAAELCFPVEKLTSEAQACAQSQAWENEAVYACAGYAAVLAAGYSENEAVAGCASDFEIAESYTAAGLDAIKARALSLMMESKNVRAVSRLADEVLRRKTLDSDHVEMLLDVADGNATEQDYQQYLILKDGHIGRAGPPPNGR